MDQFDWRINFRAEISSGLQLHVLQREVRDSTVFAEDVVPFKHQSSVWIIDEVKETPLAEEGVLVDFTSSSDADHLAFAFKNGKISSIRVSPVSERELTIWRFNDSLDMLQVRLTSLKLSVYGQTGGLKTLATFANLSTAPRKDPSLLRALHIYQTGRLPQTSPVDDS